MTLFGLTALRLGLLQLLPDNPPGPFWSFSTHEHGHPGDDGAEFLSFSKSCTLLKMTLTSSTAPGGAVRDFSPQEVNLCLPDIFFEVFSFILHWLKMCIKILCCKWLPNKQFLSFFVLWLWFFFTKAVYHAPSLVKLQACILYKKEVIIFFRLVTFIRVYCTSIVCCILRVGFVMSP